MALAVPAHDSSGEVVAAVNISAYALRASAVVLEHEYLPVLQECVKAIERESHPSLRNRARLLTEPDPMPGPRTFDGE